MEAFTERFRALAEGMTAGDPLDDATALGPLIAPAQGEKVMAFIERAKREGAKLVCGGEQLEVSGFPGGFFVAATIFASVEDEMELAREEVFGPVASLLSFASEEEAVRRANATPYGLAAGVFSRDLARAWRVAGELEAGVAWINGYNTTPVELPFGGAKGSGFGRENGTAGLESWSQWRSVQVVL